MHDLDEVLQALPRTVTPPRPSAETVAADLARGHRAVARRRRNRIAGSCLAVAAVAAVAVSVAELRPAGSPAGTGSDATTQQASGIQLVAFTGTQPEGFRVSTVPAGWQVISSDRYAFVVAPPGAQPSAAAPLAADPRTSATARHGVSYDGRIAVMLQGMSELPSDKPAKAVSVNGRKGLLGFTEDGDALWLIFPDAAGNKILVQVPASLGLTNEQIVSFAKGITVTKGAQSGVG
jgi:hypothetical protein